MKSCPLKTFIQTQKNPPQWPYISITLLKELKHINILHLHDIIIHTKTKLILMFKFCDQGLIAHNQQSHHPQRNPQIASRSASLSSILHSSTSACCFSGLALDMV